MEDWWEAVANLGRDALIWLLGLATHGGTYRDKPPTLGAGKTSNVTREAGKAQAYAKRHDLGFDFKKGYKRLRSVEVMAPNGKTGSVLTKAKDGGHMQLSRPVGIMVFHNVASNAEFRHYLEGKLFIGDQAAEDPFFTPHDDAPITMQASPTNTEGVYAVTAEFTCLGCPAAVEHEYVLRPHGDPGHEHAPYTYVQVVCPQCGLAHRHFRGHPWCPPENYE